MIDELNASGEICSMFDAAWSAIDWTPLNLVKPPRILWERRGDQQPEPAKDEPYVRVTITPVDAGQASLGGARGQRKWGNVGLVSVQSFGPLEWQNGYEVAEYVAIMAKRVFQGKSTPNGIGFSNCRAKRIGPTGGWYQFNTLTEYQFDELR